VGAFYGRKIVNKEINVKTGKAWTIKDVPAYWQEKTKNWIEEN
jgi:hypothetical protein